MEQKQYENVVRVAYEDNKNETVYDRSMIIPKMHQYKAQMSSNLAYESDDLLSVESIDEDDIRQNFEQMIQKNELVHGQIKMPHN